MPHNEVETLEAALNFIAQYELPIDPQNLTLDGFNGLDHAVPTDAVNVTQVFEQSNTFKKSHSLEIPEQHKMLQHSHSLEIPDQEATEFDAAEAFLDEFVSDKDLFGQERPQLTVPSQTNKSAGNIATPSMSGRHRQRLSRKEEITDLRDTVAELSEQLDALQASSSSGTEDRVGSILSQPESLWQQVAARQLVLRQKAEEANAQLRSMIETRVRQTKNLKRMFSRRNDAETLELVGLKRRKHFMRPGPPPKDNAQVFEKLLKGTNEMYAGLDKLFIEKGMAQVPCPGRKRQVHRNAVNGAIVVFLDKNQVPFDLKKTETAVWKLLTGRHRKDGPYTQGTIDWESQEDGDIVTNYVSFNCVAGDVSAQLQVREAARKFATEDQVTFICRSVMEPTPSGVYGSSGLKFYETMSVVLKRGEPLASGQDTTIIESYLCATRHDEGTELARKFRGEVYVDIAIEGWERTLSENNQDIENLLFDEAIRVG
ncbi:hypothetical protein PHYBOEH_007522 [Phytophthora boehmeriae]|uniref:M96 mating-specific protein family n=1 Tax=Phytophthora boehmeriae TaxID=109152 RepID=A0A8T1W7T1_9STRA|nr:hypothetical protein PHYBOEH_007522 [Phytophthora boehmeriae]